MEELRKVKMANNFNKYNITVDGEVRTVKELMETTNNQMISLLDSMVPYLDALTVDCVAKCAPKRCTYFHFNYLHCVKSVQIRSYFWSVFSCIRIEYGDLRSKSAYSIRIQENMDQK